VDDPADCGAMLDQALNTPGPVLVEAVVDPFEPPFPAKITMEQAANFAKALAKGTPNRKKIALTVLSDRVREMI
jgi:pyruvate dehydrogenase (quinone)